LHLDYTKVIILILWWRNFQLEYWRTFQLVSTIIGSGGNINKLYRLADKKDKKQSRLPITSLQELYDKLKVLTLEQRMEEFNLKTDRADVIVPAAGIFLIIAGIVKAEYIHVPVIGLADGIIDNLYAIDLKTE